MKLLVIFFPFSNLFAFIFTLIILVVAVTFIFFFLKSKKRCEKEITRVLKFVQKFKRETLSQNFEELNQKLSNDSFIGHFWSEFVKTLIITKNKEGKELIFRSVDAKYFFNEENLIYPKINLQLYKTVPAILTGLGILGTFLGLTFGLSKINLSTSDVNVLKEGIKGLLSGVGIAFSTSVWGIGLSIFFLFIKYLNLNTLLKNLTQLQITIDKLFIHKPSEDFLADILWEAKEQTAELKRFNEELAINIAAALDEKLAERLTPALEKLLDAIEELTQTGTTQIAKAISQEAGTEIIKLKDVLVEVRETLQNTVIQSQKTHQEITETFQQFLKTVEEKQTTFSTKLQEIVQSLVSKLKESLSYQQEEIKIATSQVTEKFLNSFAKISTSITTTLKVMEEKINDLISLLTKRIEKLANQYQIEQEKLEELIQQINSMVENFQTAVKEANRVAEAFAQSAQPLKEVNTQLIQAVERTQEISEFLKETFSSSQEILKDYLSKTQDTLIALKTASQKTQEAWQAYENKFGEIREDLEDVFEKMGKGLQEYANVVIGNVRDVLSKFDTLLSEAVTHLAGGVEELKEAVEELEEKLGKLSSG